MTVRHTSVAAHDPASPRRRNQGDVIATFVRARGARGATIDEIHVGTGLLFQTVCGRTNKLYRDGVLLDSNTTRPTRTDRQAIVWVHADHAGPDASPHPGGTTVRIGPKGSALLTRLSAANPGVDRKTIIYRALRLLAQA